MGLLDFSGFVGDDTAKDEYGLTQADRRQPLWSGLFKAGMLGMAAGENITPGQRAQLMGQIGGAVGGIPEAMTQQKAEAAQMQLRRQQYTAGQAKLDQAAKIRAYAQTPEFAEAVKGLPAHVQFGLKTAIETGDIDTFGRLMNNVEANKSNDRAGIPAGWERDPTTGGIRKMPGYKTEGEGGLQHAPDRAAHGYLLEALRDPAFAAKPEYAWALDYLSKPQPLPGGGSTTPIDPSKYPKATHPSVTGQPTDPNDPKSELPPGHPESVQKIAKDMKFGEERVVDGVTITKDAGGTVTWDTSTDTVEGKRYRQPPGGKVETLPSLKSPNADQMKVFTGNMEVVGKVEAALAELAAHPDAQLGFTGSLPLSQYTDEKGEKLRDLIKDLSNMTIHERAGASQTATELKTLSFVPSVNDRMSVAKRKLEDLKKYVDDKTRSYVETATDVRVPSNVKQRYRGGAPAVPPAQGGGPKLNEGEKNLGPANGGGFIIQLPNGDKVVRGG